MVGPITDEEREAASRRLRAGFVGLVAGSASLTAFYGDASLAEIGLVTAVGAVAGGAILVALGVGFGRE